MPLVNVDKYSAAGAQAVRNEVKRRDDEHRPEPTEAEADAIALEADRQNCYGFDWRTRAVNGEPRENGIGSWPDKFTGNHFTALRKYEGQAAWERAVRQLYKDNPQRAKQIGLPELPRA
jgi:hypothetical protein